MLEELVCDDNIADGEPGIQTTGDARKDDAVDAVGEEEFGGRRRRGDLPPTREGDDYFGLAEAARDEATTRPLGGHRFLKVVLQTGGFFGHRTQDSKWHYRIVA